MQVSICPDLSQLRKLVSGQLPAANVETLVQHLDTCPGCMAKVPELAAQPDTLVELLRQAKTPPVGWQDPVIGRLIARLAQLRRGPEVGPKMLIFPCPACGKNMKAGADLAGKNVKCPGCSQVVAAPVRPTGVDEKTLPPREPVAENRGSVIQGLALSSVAGQAPPPKESFDFLSPPRQPDELGRLGSYRVLKKLGSGGMGVVFLAEDTLLHRKVALKTMLPAYAADAQNRERFLREARAAASIEHDHIVAIHQVGEDNGVPYLAMPLLKGEPLDARLEREGKLPLPECLRIAAEMAEGLAAAHAAGLIHRDVKPGNVWLEAVASGQWPVASKDNAGPLTTARVKLLDFGLARSQRDDARLTRSGAVLGTPAYMPPEQAQGETVDARADLFSLGCVLYEMLTGERPFRGDNTISLLAALALQEPTPPHVKNPEVPVAVSDLTMRLLAKKPEGRPASAGEAARLLRGQLLIATREQGPAGKATPAKASPIATFASKWRRSLLTACALLLLVPLGYWATQVIIIRDKDGNEIARVKVPKDGSFEVVPEKGAEGGKKEEPKKDPVKPPEVNREDIKKDYVKPPDFKKPDAQKDPMMPSIENPQPLKIEGNVKTPFLDGAAKFDLWEKKYPIRIKSVGCFEKELLGGAKAKDYCLKFLCVYTADDKKSKVRLPNEARVWVDGKLTGGRGAPLEGFLYFFDEDGVVIGRAANEHTTGADTDFFEGKLTGMEGDAFRYVVPLGQVRALAAPLLENVEKIIGAKRIELREKSVGLTRGNWGSIGMPQMPTAKEEKLKPAFAGQNVNYEIWEKNQPIKIKGTSCFKSGQGQTGQPPYVLKFLCVYTEDVKESKVPPFSGQLSNGVLYFFDVDGVVISQVALANVGPQCRFECEELTGIKGDAFRYCVPIPQTAIAAKRIELRER